MKNINHLHDATLIDVILNWESGDVIISLKPSDEILNIFILPVSECSMLKITRDLPWGKSVSVNDVTINEDIENVYCAIKMQSGDKIEVVGQKIQLTSS